MKQNIETNNFTEVISTEEYLAKRQKIREKERKRNGKKEKESPDWMLTELYV